MSENGNKYLEKMRSISIHVSRRTFVGAGASAVAAAVLAACGKSNSSTSTSSSSSTTVASTGGTAASSSSAAASAASTGSAGSGGTAAATGSTNPVRGVSIPDFDNPPIGKPQGDKPNELIVSYGIDQLTTHWIDPQLHVATTDEAKLRHIYEPLVKFERDLQTISPHLATEWNRVNPTTMQFKLKQGVTFQNGEPFNAEAVKYSIMRPLSDETPSDARSSYLTIKSVDVVDEFTVNVNTVQPDPALLARMSGFAMTMVPPKWASQGAQTVANEAYGTGPYKLTSWKPKEDMVLEAWDGYWGDKPEIKNVRFHTITEAATRVAALRSGQVHIAKDIPPEDMDGVNSGGRARISRAVSNRVPFYYVTVSEDLYKDPKVRQAINYAANVDGVIESVLVGNGHRVSTVLPIWCFGYDPTLKPYPNDPDKAKSLLKEAGHADGIEANIWYLQGRYTKDKEVAEAMAQEMANGGIKCKTNLLDSSVLTDMQTKSQTPGLDFASWGNWFFDADNTFIPLFSCEAAQQFPDFRRPYGCNKALEDVITAARTELDIEKRKSLYAQAQKILYDDAGALFMYQLVDIFGVNNWVQWDARHDEMVWAWEMKWNTA
jgi:peptide/nickel transport system substrate-binding protein